jgi:hypothetical protein
VSDEKSRSNPNPTPTAPYRVFVGSGQHKPDPRGPARFAITPVRRPRR